MLVLRRFENEDVAILEKWLKKEHVAKWFGDAADWLYEIEHRKDEYNFIQHFIVEAKGSPIGFCQYYDWNKAYEEEGVRERAGTYGIDYMIGDERFLGKGLGNVLVQLICDKVTKEQPDAIMLMADPIIEDDRVNKLSIKVLEKNGFRYDVNAGVYRRIVCNQ